MAQRLNKKLVAGLTIAGMLATAVIAGFMLKMLPKTDPGPTAALAAEAASSRDYATAAKLYERAAGYARAGGKDMAESNKYLLLAGDNALASGDARLALGCWRSVVLNDPQNEEAQEKIVAFMLELAQMRRQSWGEVLTQAETLVGINPDNGVALHAGGLALINQKDVRDENQAEGEKKLEAAFNGDKGNAEFADSLARHYFNGGQEEKAFAVYEELIANLPEDKVAAAEAWRRRGRFYLATMTIHQLKLRNMQSQRASAADIEARRESVAPMDQGALESLIRADEILPDNVDNLIALGEYWGAKRSSAIDAAEKQEEEDANFAKAADFYKKAIQLDADGYEAYLRLARLHLQRREFDNALQVLDARRKRGVRREGYLGAQNKWFMATIRNEMYTVSMVRAEQNRRASDGEDDALTKEIIARLDELYKEQAADSGEEDPGVLFMKGRLLMLQGEPFEAIKTLRQAEKLVPDAVPEIKQYLAQLYLRNRQYGEAEEALKVVLQAYPTNAVAWATQAALQVDLARPGEALQAADRALQLDPKNVPARMAKARVYEMQQNWDKLAEIQQEIREIQSGAQEAGQPVADANQDKVQRAAIYRLQAESGDVLDRNLLGESEKLLREVLSDDPLNMVAMQQLASILGQDRARSGELVQLLDELKSAAQGKIDTLSAASQPSEKQARQYANVLATIEQFRIFADPDASEEDKIQRTEAVLKQGQDPFEVAMGLYRLYSGVPARADDALAQLKLAHQLQPKQSGVVEALFIAALRNKDWALADDMVKKAVELHIAPLGGRYYRGRILQVRTDIEGNYEKAAEEFRAGLAEFPTFWQAWVELARTLVQLQQYDDATRAYQEALRLNPRNPAAVLGMAMLASYRGDEAEKLKYLELCAQMIPEHPWVREELQALQDIRDPARGITRREEIRKTQPENVDNLIRLAELYVKQGDRDQAKACYEECRRLQPTNLQIAGRYAEFLRGQSPTDAASATEMLKGLVQGIGEDDGIQKAGAQLMLARHLESLAVQGGPQAPDRATIDAAYAAAAEFSDRPSVLLDVGVYHMTNDHFADAEQWFRKALAAAQQQDRLEDEKRARRLIIDAILQSKDSAREEDLNKEFGAYQARFDDAFVLLARSENQLNNGRLDQALEYISQYVTRQPGDALGYLKRGEIYFQRSLWEQAAEDYRKAKAADPDGYNYRHRIRLARCLQQLGQEQLAVAELSGILAEAPQQPEALRSLFGMFISQKNWTEAEKLIKPRAEKDPDNPYWSALLMGLYEASGNPDNAIKYGIEGARQSGFALEQVDAFLRSALNLHRYDDLLRFVNQTLPAEHREHPRVLLRVAAAHAGKGDRTEALSLYNRVLDAMRSDLEQSLGVAMDIRQRLGAEVAADVVRQRLAAKPDDPAMRLIQASFEKDAGDRVGYIAMVQELLKGAPADDPQLVPRRLFLLRALSATKYQQEAYDEAKALYEEMLDLNPQDEVALNNLAFLTMDHLQDPKAALSYSRQAAELRPNDPNIIDTLGWNLVLLGQLDDGIAAFRRAISLDDTVATIHYHLAEAFYRRSGTNPATREIDLREAENECRRAHQLVVSKGNDAENVWDQIIALSDKLGLGLSATLQPK